MNSFLETYFVSQVLMHCEKYRNFTFNFLVWKFCGKVQFPHSFGEIARNYAETVPFHKISMPRN